MREIQSFGKIRFPQSAVLYRPAAPRSEDTFQSRLNEPTHLIPRPTSAPTSSRWQRLAGICTLATLVGLSAGLGGCASAPTYQAGQQPTTQQQKDQQALRDAERHIQRGGPAKDFQDLGKDLGRMFNLFGK